MGIVRWSCWYKLFEGEASSHSFQMTSVYFLTKCTDWKVHCFFYGFVFEAFTAIVSLGLISVDAARLSVPTVSWLVAIPKTESLCVHPSPNMCPYYSSFIVSRLGGMRTKLRRRVFLVEHYEASQHIFLSSSPYSASIFLFSILHSRCQNKKVRFLPPCRLLQEDA